MSDATWRDTAGLASVLATLLPKRSAHWHRREEALDGSDRDHELSLQRLKVILQDQELLLLFARNLIQNFIQRILK